MSSFTTKLVGEITGNGTITLTEPFVYCVGELGSDTQITVPVGFVTDLDSMPRLARLIYPELENYGKAAVVHDYLYQQQTYSRKQSDDIFLEAMGVLGVGMITKYSIYYSVRLFGGLAWKTK